jgi:chemotaxis signal transduction protein
MRGDEKRATLDAGELKRRFDSTFALPRAEQREAFERFIRVETAGQPYAFRVREISGLLPAKDVVPLPVGSAAPFGLLGLCGVRGALVPVFSLAALLGQGSAGARGADEAPQWLVLCGRADDGRLGLVALGVSRFLGYAEATRSFIHSAAPGGRSVHVPEILEAAEAFHNIVSVESLTHAIQREK